MRPRPSGHPLPARACRCRCGATSDAGRQSGLAGSLPRARNVVAVAGAAARHALTASTLACPHGGLGKLPRPVPRIVAAVAACGDPPVPPLCPWAGQQRRAGRLGVAAQPGHAPGRQHDVDPPPRRRLADTHPERSRARRGAPPSRHARALLVHATVAGLCCTTPGAHRLDQRWSPSAPADGADFHTTSPTHCRS
jgi:hypothetical protein